MSFTREFDAAVGELRPNVLGRAEDAVVLEGIIARIRAGDPAPSQDSISGSSNANAPEEPNPTADPDPDAFP
jgi:hypothetical protein